MADNELIATLRDFVKDNMRKRFDFRNSDQSRGVKAPKMQAVLTGDELTIQLPPPEKSRQLVGETSLFDAVAERCSERRFAATPLSVDELGWLLWATQGVREVGGKPYYRTVPSAGARHSFNTYLILNRVTSIPPGLYRYQPISHELVFIRNVPRPEDQLSSATFGQRFIGTGAVVFVWASVPYRMEWRYGPTAHRVILIDAGHVGQNLYLACEAIGCGTCTIAAYDQQAMDALLGIDGEEEFTVYLAPVGKKI